MRASGQPGEYRCVDRNLHRYWIRIEPGQALTGEAQFGVTAYSETDALEILRYLVFTTAGLPEIAEVVAVAERGGSGQTAKNARLLRDALR